MLHREYTYQILHVPNVLIALCFLCFNSRPDVEEKVDLALLTPLLVTDVNPGRERPLQYRKYCT